MAFHFCNDLKIHSNSAEQKAIFSELMKCKVAVKWGDLIAAKKICTQCQLKIISEVVNSLKLYPEIIPKEIVTI